MFIVAAKDFFILHMFIDKKNRYVHILQENTGSTTLPVCQLLALHLPPENTSWRKV
jgi:hypothetical protein